jgi:hemoglobin-like flavoprotein
MTIEESARRVLEDRDGVAAIFYETFFDRVPEAKPFFAEVNLKHQTVLLTMSLMVVERHYKSGYAATQLYLKYLGHKHHQRGVPPELYPRWVESLLVALGTFHGPDWDAEAASQWRAALDRAVELMLAGYREAITV